MPGTIACQKREARKAALSYKTPLQERSLWSKLNCLNSSCQLGLKVPLSQRRARTRSHLIYVLLSYVTWSMNQMLHVSSHMKQDIMNIHNATNRGPKEIVKLINGNVQAPKCLPQTYGAGALQVPFSFIKGGGIRGQAIYATRTRPYCKCSNTSTSKGVKKLETIYYIRTNKPDFKFKRVYNLILSEDLFVVAYQNLKSKKGIITPGTDLATPDGLRMSYIRKTLAKLQKETFQFRPARRILIPKPNGELRPLSIPSFEDKLVQEVIRIILESIYEPTFAPYSHGFRKGKRCHTALKDVRVTFAGVKWLITRDINKCFDSFNHQKLIDILEKRISDQRFINLMWKLLRAGYINDFKTLTTSLTGVPQGGVVSPILSNIYLHELDLFIGELIKEFYKGKRRATSRKYSNFRQMYNYWKNKDTDLSRAYLYLRNSTPSKDPQDKGYRRLLYIRYADDFIIGLISRAKEAQQIKQKVNSFLSTNLLLTVSSDKNKLVRASKDRAKFLGVKVRIPIYKEPAFTAYKRTRFGKTQLIKAKSSQGVVKLKADIKAIIMKLNSAGFCDKQGVPTPRFQLYAITQSDIILIYNRVFRGLKNYFRFVDNFSTLAFRVQYILIRSCAKLLAAKLKLKTTKAVYKKFGKNLNATGVKFIWSKSHLSNRIRFITNKHSSDCIYTLYMKKYVNSDLLSPCVVCGSLDKIEMHHVKHVKNINKGLRPLVKDYATINRKQVPLCSRCHRMVHKGLYDGPKLDSF